MSKAQQWAEKLKSVALEKRRLDDEAAAMNPGEFRRGNFHIRVQANGNPIVYLGDRMCDGVTYRDVVELGRWLLDTFDDSEAAAPAPAEGAAGGAA